MKRLLAYLRGSTAEVPNPAEWMLEVTNRCNLACPMCLRDKVDFVTQDMDHELIHSLFERNPPPNALWPYGYGEPLLYPSLFDVIRYAKTKGVVVSLSTNATTLNDHTGDELLASGLDYLIVAFDGATRQTYERYRRGASFDSVKTKVNRFLAKKVRSKASLHVTMQMILMDGTSQELAAFRGMWNKPGVDCVRIREDLLKAGNSNNNCYQTKPRPCFFLWRGPLFVQAGGSMIPCPYYHGAEPFGDLRTQTVAEAWNSPQMEQLRKAHLAGDLSSYPLCASCPRYQPHPALAAASFFINTDGIRRFMPLAERIQHGLGRRFFE